MWICFFRHELPHAGGEIVEVLNVRPAWSVALEDGGCHRLQRVRPSILAMGGGTQVEGHPHLVLAVPWVESEGIFEKKEN